MGSTLFRLSKIAPLVFLWVVSAAPLHAPRQGPPNLADADRYYEEKSFSVALGAYRFLLNAGSVPAARKNDVELRVLVSLGESKQWDTVFDAGVAFVRAHRGTVWEPRALSVLGRFYMKAPHNGYRIAGKIVRERNDEREYDSGDEGVALYAQDVQNSRDALEAAAVLYRRFRAEFHTEQDEIQNAFDLSRVLREFFVESWASKREWAPADSQVWRIDPTAPFDPTWPPPKKLAYIYSYIERLAGSDAHQAALALLGKAAWLRSYHTDMSQYAWSEEYPPVWKPYPYEDERPERTLEALIARFPDDPVRDQAEMILASVRTEQGQMKTAEQGLETFLKERPSSDAAAQAKDFLRRIREPELSFHTSGVSLPAKRTALEIKSRNIREIHFAAYRFDLTRAIDQAEIEKPERATANRNAQSYRLVDVQRFLALKGFEAGLVKPAAEWDETIPDPGDHLFRTKKSSLPPVEIGSYLLKASAPGVSTAGIALVTDLALIVKSHGARDLYYVADAATGWPVAGARLTVSAYDYRDHTLKRATTGADGLADVKIPSARQQSSDEVRTLASVGQRYALVEPESTAFRHEDQNVRTFGVMDRGVYRPGQTVRFRQIVMHATANGWKPLAGRKVTVLIQDPRSSPVHSQTLTTNAFGSVHGQYTLPADAALGQYFVGAEVSGDDRNRQLSGGASFRVEEFKKPEFRVTVSAGKLVRVGQRSSAVVRAQYYFGAPVVGAAVSYRVYRSDLFGGGSYYDRQWKYAYLWSPRYARSPDFRRDDMAAQGTTRTDARGEARITFPATARPLSSARGGQWSSEADLAYMVEADVRDASRRTVSATGLTRAVRHDFFIQAKSEYGYFRPGEPVEIQVETTDGEGAPVAASGKAQILRQRGYQGDEKDPVATLDWRTGRDGRGSLRWIPTQSGSFTARFQARDSNGSEIRSWGAQFWVHNPRLPQRSVRKDADRGAGGGARAEISVILRLDEVEEGAVAHALLVAPETGCTVLLTREADREILGRRILRMEGQETELTLPVGARDIPGITLQALTVRNGEVIGNRSPFGAELKVAAVRHMARVTVQPDRARYQPGQNARLRLHAQDVRGRPLRTELSLSVSDSSLETITASRQEDIRSFLYGDYRTDWVRTGTADSQSFASQLLLEHEPDRNVYVNWRLPPGMGLLDLGENDYYRDMGLWVEVQFPDAAQVESGELRRPHRMGFGMGGQASPSMTVDEQRRGGRRDREPSVRLAEAVFRKHFLETAFWAPSVVTDAHGDATAEFTWPDNLTEWNAVAVGTTQNGIVGEDTKKIQTAKDLLVRVQSPRFLVERDRVDLSANVHNYTPSAVRALVKVDLLGGAELAHGGVRTAERWIDLPKGGEKRVDWSVQAVRAGDLKLRVSARSVRAADAEEIVVPVLPHGTERSVTASGVLRDANARAETQIEVPASREKGSTRLTVTMNPSLATVIVEALPYLAQYPYGCIEQTTSRFIPCVIVARTLKDLGIRLEELRRPKSSGDPITDRLRQVHFGSAEEAERLRSNNPVFDKRRLDDMIRTGLKRITAWQHADGGWGWWQHDESDPHMTEYVLRGLLLAREAGVKIPEVLVTKGLTYLQRVMTETSDLSLQVGAARVLLASPATWGAGREAALHVYESRDKLGSAARAELASTLVQIDEREKAQLMLRILENTAQVDEANGMVHWSPRDGMLGSAFSSLVETNAAILEAHLVIAPTSRFVPMLAKWLAGNRRGSAWMSTRETAVTVLALAHYVQARKELSSGFVVTVELGKRVHRTVRFDSRAALLGRAQIVLDDAQLASGRQPLRITRSGSGTAYWSADLRYRSREEPISASANELEITRRYYRIVAGSARTVQPPVILDENRPNPFLTGQYELLVPAEWGQALEGESDLAYDRVPLKEGEQLAAGEIIEAEIAVDAHNFYSYVLVEDPKPSGCEPVELRSGEADDHGVCSHMELHDTKAAFFITRLPQGKRAITYRLRAETPGRFHVLPARGYAMYAPEVQGISAEGWIGVSDPR